LGADLLDGGAGNDILLGDVGYAVRRFDDTGAPRLNAVTTRTDSAHVWHKDIVLEEVGRITSSHLISTRLNTNSLKAEDIALASLLIVASEFSGSSKATNATRGGWPTELILFDYFESSRNGDKLHGGTGDDICIGQVIRRIALCSA
jgi:Ca2+-binding RTX toxin-like protein